MHGSLVLFERSQRDTEVVHILVAVLLGYGIYAICTIYMGASLVVCIRFLRSHSHRTTSLQRY
jgi:hypothetical protein